MTLTPQQMGGCKTEVGAQTSPSAYLISFVTEVTLVVGKSATKQESGLIFYPLNNTVVFFMPYVLAFLKKLFYKYFAGI